MAWCGMDGGGVVYVQSRYSRGSNCMGMNDFCDDIVHVEGATGVEDRPLWDER